MSSEWSVRIVEISDFEKHPNADTLSITQVDGGYPCIFRTGEFQTGEVAVYIPVDSVVPDTEEYSFLKKRRIEAMRLRGIFSMGLLRPVPDELKGQVKVGDDVGELLGIVKYVQGGVGGKPFLGGECERAPEHFMFPRYTDHLPLRKYGNILIAGESVQLSEKVHGCNVRLCHDGDRLWVGSHGQIKKEDRERNLWWKLVDRLELDKKLAVAPFKVFFGEVFGQVQDLKYGRKDTDLRIFDVFDTKTGRYMDVSDAAGLAHSVGLKWVPVLYVGPWDPSLIEQYANGPSMVEGADCIREGFVARPLLERWEHAGRVSMKYAGSDYLLRKNKVDIEE